MKHITYIIMFLSLLLSSGCASHKSMIFEHTNQNVNLEINVVKNKCSSITVSTSDPITLRTFIMQGFTLSLFSGSNNIFITFPSAKDVEDKVKHHPNEVKASINDNKEKRPDVRPVINAINAGEVIYCVNKNPSILKTFMVSIDPSSGLLSYHIDFPKPFRLNLPSVVDLKSSPASFSHVEFTPINSNDSINKVPFYVGGSMELDNQKELYISFFINHGN